MARVLHITSATRRMRMKRQTSEMEDRLPGLFEPHTILPVQFFTRLQRSAAWTGEQRLMGAILEDAIGVACKTTAPKTSKSRSLLRETLRWIRSNDRKWAFSFLRICETLDLDPSAIRRGVRVRRGEELPLTMPRIVTQPPVPQFEEPRRVAVG